MQHVIAVIIPTPSDKDTNMNPLEIRQFARRSFEVDAVLVTEDNIALVAEWCGGEVRSCAALPDSGKDVDHYIKVRVYHPLNERQTKAFVGDWVLYAGKGYKVYTQKSFEASFEAVDA